MEARGAAIILSALFLAGCMQEAAVVPQDLPPAAIEVARFATSSGCAGFCEPSVAIDAQGRIFALGDVATVSLDGAASFASLELPPAPLPNTFQTDSMLEVAPDGTLWYSALIASCGTPLCTPFFLLGIQVARSDDAGETWRSQHLTFPAHARALGADRQWLSFGPDGRVCVTFQHIGAALLPPFVPLPVRPYESDLRLSCAEDGWTFPEFSSLAPQLRGLINGRPAFDAEGRMLIPLFLYTEDPPLQVAVSEDGGASFEMRPVGGNGAWFPSLAVDAEGRAHMLWNTLEGVLHHAVSSDAGRTWSAPQALGKEPVSSPWIAARGDGVAAAWFEAEGEGETNRLVFWDGNATTVLAEGLPNGEYRYAATDFAHFAVDPEGRALVIYGDLDAEDARLAVVG